MTNSQTAQCDFNLPVMTVGSTPRMDAESDET